MKVTATRNIISSTEEILDVHLEFNPSNPDEEGMAALIATLIDLVNKYNRLNTLAGD